MDNYILLVLLGVVCLIIVIILSTIKIKFPSYWRQIWTQRAVYAIELVILPTIFMYLFNNKYGTKLEFFKDYAFFLGTYQGLLYLFLKVRDTSDIDCLLDNDTMIKEIVLKLEYNRDITQKEIEDIIKNSDNDKIMINKYNRVIKKEIGTFLGSFNENKIEKNELIWILKDYLIKIEHQLSSINLEWRNSMFLRLLK